MIAPPDEVLENAQSAYAEIVSACSRCLVKAHDRDAPLAERQAALDKLRAARRAIEKKAPAKR